jgi:hypothetical protein
MSAVGHAADVVGELVDAHPSVVPQRRRMQVRVQHHDGERQGVDLKKQ